MRHNVFVSYHHGNDQNYRNRFEEIFSNYYYNIMVSKSVQIGDINEHLPSETIRQKIRDEYLRDSTVTVVLIGSETWKRKHVDWEIGSSLRQTKYNSRSGLIGILLPSYHNYYNVSYGKFNHNEIPPRLSDNLKNGFAKLYDWSDNPQEVQQWIDEAFKRRKQINPDNSFPPFIKNRTSIRWQR